MTIAFVVYEVKVFGKQEKNRPQSLTHLVEKKEDL